MNATKDMKEGLERTRTNQLQGRCEPYSRLPQNKFVYNLEKPVEGSVEFRVLMDNAFITFFKWVK